VSSAIIQATGVEDYNILQNNGSIAHQGVFLFPPFLSLLFLTSSI
jgi:hypothetical protein